MTLFARDKADCISAIAPSVVLGSDVYSEYEDNRMTLCARCANQKTIPQSQGDSYWSVDFCRAVNPSRACAEINDGHCACYRPSLFTNPGAWIWYALTH